jgi:hypothetical protein
MAADEILMDPSSALGPIDAQMSWAGKSFSADALLRGFERIKEEVRSSGALNKAYIPILQGISPGELQNAQNAQDFSKKLVAEWLAKYKFKAWTKHSSSGKSVTDQERADRADEIAEKLRDHGQWMTHGRSIKIADLEAMKLKVHDYSKEPELFEAIRRYYILLQLTFQGPAYKVFETIASQIYRQAGIIQAPGGPHRVNRCRRSQRPGRHSLGFHFQLPSQHLQKFKSLAQIVSTHSLSRPIWRLIYRLSQGLSRFRRTTSSTVRLATRKLSLQV